MPLTVPSANDNLDPSSPDINQSPNRPSDSKLLMAAAIMNQHGRLTEQQQEPQPGARQQYTAPTPGGGGTEYSDVYMDPKEVGEQFRTVTSGIRIKDPSGQRRSEEVEDKRVTSQVGEAEVRADLAMARQKFQPRSQPTAEDVARTGGQPDLTTTKMAKQLGINDVDAFMEFIQNQRAKEANTGMDKLKAAMKAR